jgi:NAD(P)H-dependent FMN reductase
MNKPHIVIISSSIRTGRKSHRVALYFESLIPQSGLGTCEILDLKSYNFPLFPERLKYQQNPSDPAIEFSEKVKAADGVIVVTPEYNGGYPAALKNALDLLADEWFHKPLAIATVSSGIFGGSQVITSLQFSFWKIKARIANAMFPVPQVDKSFDENGEPADVQGTEKRAMMFLKELIGIIDQARDNKPD